MSGFEIKDSGARTEYESGMMRDKADDKIEFWSMRIGPMFQRWAQLLTNGRKKYPDTAPGVPNWTLAAGEAELLHAKASLTRHFEQYLRGDTDEDHAAAIFFNVNLMEYIKEKMDAALAQATDTEPGTFSEALSREWAAAQADAARDDKRAGYGDLGPVTTRVLREIADEDRVTEDQLRLREYKDRMARERAILDQPLPPSVGYRPEGGERLPNH